VKRRLSGGCGLGLFVKMLMTLVVNFSKNDKKTLQTDATASPTPWRIRYIARSVFVVSAFSSA